ncbi:MAG: hypothetical protein ACXWQO_10090 [Bdellovibrionota bacterium]
MAKIELVYFSGCPNVVKARDAILAAGAGEFSEVVQELLPKESAYLRFSSPTVLVNGKIAIGSENGAAACSMIDWLEASAKISSCKRNA